MDSLLTADNIKAVESWIRFFTHPGTLYVVALMGMFSHYLKKLKKGETPTEVYHYFRDNFSCTLTSVMATTILFVMYLVTAYRTGSNSDILTVFLLGYTSDSMFNQYDTTLPSSDKVAEDIISKLKVKIKGG